MTVVIPEATRMTPDEIRCDIAVLFFQKEKLTLAQAARFAGLSQSDFMHLLSSRQIPIHYGVDDLEEDMETLQEMGRL